MTQWLIETLLWTGLLIGLVLFLRRPVGRYFGPKAAYALWTLPFLRLIMPPLVLPAWLAPAASAPPQPITHYAGYTANAADLASIPARQVAAIAPEPFAWAGISLAIWLLGAAIFLAVRFYGYFRMRRALLADAVSIGQAGRVRLVETPQAAAPLAFGVTDKVVALPPGFMALHKREQRDFALAHELAHHSGGDLLVNMVAQPLFALHWFNPLGWLGWRAMRRDQEAACDARVIARRSAEEKATYAETIASFAASPRFALAAPMACPVLGEKSIIHRLRSISMTDISPRRRLAGRALIGASLLALPLTATISFAESINSSAPSVPSAPSTPPAAPQPPQPPQPPAPPLPPSAEEMVAKGEFETVFDDIEATEDGSGEARRVIVMRSKDGAAAAPGDRPNKRMLIFSGHGPADAAGDPKKLTWTHKEDRIGGEGMSAEERAEMRREVRESMAEMKHDLAEARKEMMIFKNEKGEITKFTTDCKEGQSGPGQCHTAVMANALAGLKKARAEIAVNKDMDSEIRAEVLKALDEAIADWKTGG